MPDLTYFRLFLQTASVLDSFFRFGSNISVSRNLTGHPILPGLQECQVLRQGARDQVLAGPGEAVHKSAARGVPESAEAELLEGGGEEEPLREEEVLPEVPEG